LGQVDASNLIDKYLFGKSLPKPVSPDTEFTQCRVARWACRAERIINLAQGVYRLTEKRHLSYGVGVYRSRDLTTQGGSRWMDNTIDTGLWS